LIPSEELLLLVNSTKGDVVDWVVVSSKKPSWTIGASAPLKTLLKKKSIAPPTTNSWSIASPDIDLEDEDSLLTDEGKPCEYVKNDDLKFTIQRFEATRSKIGCRLCSEVRNFLVVIEEWLGELSSVDTN